MPCDPEVNMWIKDWWNRMLKKFKKEDTPEAENVMELKPEEAPEPVPERKTSDEMIVTMAESARQEQLRGRDGAPSRAQEDPAEGPLPEEETEEQAGPEELYDPEDPAGPDPCEDIVWQEAEDDEKEDVDEEC